MFLVTLSVLILACTYFGGFWRIWHYHWWWRL